MKQNKKLVDCLGKVLAETYILALKTQNYHWNVVGPNFGSLHILFENQYTEYAAAIDIIAERIRALGHKSPGSFKEFTKLSSINEANGKETANNMLKNLNDDQKALSSSLKTAQKEAEAMEDQETLDLMVERLSVHQKNAWMLKSSLPK